ncbi:3-oxoacyl-ACP reductase, partial [Xanthobacter sp. KR7-65]
GHGTHQTLQARRATLRKDGSKLPIHRQFRRRPLLDQIRPHGLGRVGTPEEAAGAVYLFCAPESNFISGQHIICGGGFTI